MALKLTAIREESLLPASSLEAIKGGVTAIVCNPNNCGVNYGTCKSNTCIQNDQDCEENGCGSNCPGNCAKLCITDLYQPCHPLVLCNPLQA